MLRGGRRGGGIGYAAVMTDPGRALLRAAIVYDFDGTLAPGNIQEHSLIPDYLEMSVQAFW